MIKTITKKQLLEMIKNNKLTSKEGMGLLKRFSNGERKIEILVEETQTAGPVSQDIAVIGMSGRYPMAKDLDEFWDNLKNGKDCVTEIPPERWDWRDYFDTDPAKASEGKMYNKWGGFIDDVDKFDPLFFRISPNEAETIDPQERLLLQTVWHMFEDAGYRRDRINDTVRPDKKCDVGVFVGETTNNYLLWGPELWNQGKHDIPNTFPWSIANRVSYFFNFNGPSMAVDTACSSSLAALHLACESLKKGESQYAIVGGVNLYLHPIKYVWLCQMTMLSKKGRCHTFGKDADGFEPGEGVGAILLKPLADAEADNDKIYAVIKGTAVNHDGGITGYTVPNTAAQSEVINQALDMANFDARTISLIEAHGTGTSLGDPLEIVGLTNAFRKYTEDKNYCAVSSSKSNIGHLESGAGLAGLIKIILQMQHKQLVPSLHCKEYNPKIDFANSPFVVQRELGEWKKPVVGGKEYPRRAGVSSFGAGGVNGHTLVEEYEMPAQTQPEAAAGPFLFVLSARNDKQLNVYIDTFIEFLTEANAGTGMLSDICHTLQTGRDEMDVRIAIVCNTSEELIKKLGEVKKEGDGTSVFRAKIKQFKKTLSSIRPSKSELNKITKDKNLSKLADIWTKGVKVDFTGLYGNERKRMVKLPFYPFAKQSCWIPRVKPATGEVKAQMKPVADENKKTHYPKEVKFEPFYSLAKGHVVDEYIMIPGAYQIGGVYQAIIENNFLPEGMKIQKYENVSFVGIPFIVEQQGDSGTIEFVRIENGVQYSLKSTALHSTGKVLFSSYRDSHHVQIEKIKEEIKGYDNSGTMEKQDIYNRFQKVGLEYDINFQIIQNLDYCDTRAFAELKFPDKPVGDRVGDDFDNHTLHPAMLDGALHTIIGLLHHDMDKNKYAYIPFIMKEFNIYGPLPLPKECWAHAILKKKSKTNKSAKSRTFDIEIINNDGQVLIKIIDFVVVRYIKQEKKEKDTTVKNTDKLIDLLKDLQSGKRSREDVEKEMEDLYGEL